MGIRNQFIDLIEYVDNTEKELVYKFARHNDEIKHNARLIVRDGQTAVFVYRGRTADVFGPGNYKLSTKNLPVLSTLAAFPTFFNSPIRSDVYFINTTQFIDNAWETKNAIIRRDPELGLIRIKAFGKYSFRVFDAELFMTEMFGARSLDMTGQIISYLTSMVSESIAQCIGESPLSILDLSMHYLDFSREVTPVVNRKANLLGLEIAQATVENISLPKEVEKLIDEQSGIGLASKNMDVFVQYQSARAIRDAAKQPGGLAGIGVGAAVGGSVAKSIDKSLSDTGSTKEEKRAGEPEKDMQAQAAAGDEKKKEPDRPKKEAKQPKPELSLADRLIKYKNLLDEGILTQEEFDEVKAILLKEV